MAIEIGIKPQNRKAIAQGLSRLLADTYALYAQHLPAGREGERRADR